jgi:hypothetical protein
MVEQFLAHRGQLVRQVQLDRKAHREYLEQQVDLVHMDLGTILEIKS